MPRGEIRIHEHHVAEVEARRVEHLAKAREREFHLGGRVLGDAARPGIAAQKAGNEQAPAGQHARHEWPDPLVARRNDGLLPRQIANRHGVDLDGRIGGHAVDAQRRARRRVLAEVAIEHRVHGAVIGDIAQVNLRVDHVLHGKVRGLHNGVDVLQGLLQLFREGAGGRRPRCARPARRRKESRPPECRGYMARRASSPAETPPSARQRQRGKHQRLHAL